MTPGPVTSSFAAAAALCGLWWGLASWGRHESSRSAFAAQRACEAVGFLAIVVVGGLGGLGEALLEISPQRTPAQNVVLLVGYVGGGLATTALLTMLWLLAWATVGCVCQALVELVVARPFGDLTAGQPEAPHAAAGFWPRPDPVLAAVTIASLVCFGRLWLGAR